MKPILFNTEMVVAILEGRKTVTRRVAKITVNRGDVVAHKRCKSFNFDINMDGKCVNFYDEKEFYQGASHQNIEVGEVLYVRETWQPLESVDGEIRGYHYNADGLCIWLDNNMTQELREPIKWHPSIHMPAKAARIFLKVTGVKVERLQDITQDGMIREGVWKGCADCFSNGGCFLPNVCNYVRKAFAGLWNSTCTKDELKWEANPWVWVIEFERVEKPEVLK